MHPPCDPTRTYLSQLRYQELMSEAEQLRLANQLPDPGFFAHFASVLGPRLRAILAWCSPAQAARGGLGARTSDPALGERALEI
jgi:hypothetical protein